MDEYELMDLLQGTYDKMGEDATMYFTLVSAFLAVAFLAGKRLSKAQLAIASTLYVLWALGTINSMYTGMQTALLLEERLIQMGSNLAGVAPTDFWVLSFMAVQAGGVIASLYFLWSVRSHPTAGPL
ncbi:MAG: hypothetical protein ABJN62_07125 [Halioglobus sp.]